MPPDAKPGRPLVGVALASLCVMLFALGDTITKALAMRNPVEQIAAVRFGAGLVFLIALGLAHPRAGVWRVRRKGLTVLRAVILAVATLIMGHALRLMPVGETVAIMYLAPFAVLALSVPVLGERVGARGWMLAAVGFAGVLVILRPGAGLHPGGVALALLLAGFTTAFHLVTRVLGRSESALGMLGYVTLVGFGIFALLSLPTLGGPMPSPTDLGLMALLGVIFTGGHFLFAAAGHFLFAAAYREAPASLVAPVNYLHFVWAALMGWAAFGHVPDGLTALGMALILVSGTAIALGARRG